MWFFVDCEHSAYYYNNVDNSIFNEDGLRLDYSNIIHNIDDLEKTYHLDKERLLPDCSGEYIGSSHTSFSENQYLIDPLLIRHLIIFLGTKCNYQCDYCFQGQQQYDFTFNEQRFNRLFTSSFLNVNRLVSIDLWGGEPFVYWKRFKSIIVILREHLGYKNTISTITNGSLFDDEKKNFCIKYGVQVNFSHDGQCQTIHRCNRDYMSDARIRNSVNDFLKLGHITKGRNKHGMVLPSISKYTPSFEELIDFIQKTFYKDIIIRIAGPIVYNKMTKQMWDLYTSDDILFLKKQYINAMNTTRSHPNYHNYHYLHRMKALSKHRLANNHIFTSYSGNRNVRYDPRYGITIDTDGNYISSYTEMSGEDGNRVSGNILDGPAVYKNSHVGEEQHKCIHCPYSVSCRVGNIRLDVSDFEWRCKSHMPYREAIFESAWKELVGDTIKNISPLHQNIK